MSQQQIQRRYAKQNTLSKHWHRTALDTLAHQHNKGIVQFGELRNQILPENLQHELEKKKKQIDLEIQQKVQNATVCKKPPGSRLP